MRRFKSKTCPNCGAEFSVKPDLAGFCPACGQENHDLNIPVRHLLAEVVETVFHFDTKSVRTLRALVFSPGFLTTEFIRGRRARYVSPIRLYIFISFLFFLLLSSSSGRTDERTEVEAEQSAAGGFSMTFYGINSNELRGLRNSQIDSLIQSRNISPTAMSRYVVHQMARALGGSGREFTHLIIKNFSYMVFVLMPFFGYLVYLFHRKQDPHYVGTLVFSLHFHSFAFLALTLLLLLSRVPFLAPVTLLAPIVLAIYLYMGMRSVFGQSRISALWRTIIIGALHVISVAVLFLVTVFASVVVF
ncbi:MAG: DUF3667 domain-containing protein [Ignavibacteriales bacterium]|nr:DUF3667 domain-containing protein [Ignavibacteriales bacterium]